MLRETGNASTHQFGSSQTQVPASPQADRNYFTAPPTRSLPKGARAIQGMSEKFAANPVTGTGSMSVSISITLDRGGFKPQLSIFYDSGAEDLVPVLNEAGAIAEEVRDGDLIRHYRPRIEELFARIEQWTKVDSGEIHG